MASNEDRPLTSEYEAIQQRIIDGWRMRCPNGHGDLRDQEGPSVYCQTCTEAYHYDELVDARDAATPPLVSPPEHRHP